MKKDIIQNIFFLFLEKLITIFLVFYTEGTIAKVLSISEYGQWVYSVNFILLLSSLTLVVGSEVSTVALSRNKKISGEIIFVVFIFRMIFSCVAFIISIFYALYVVNDELVKDFIIILSFFLVLAEPFGVISNYFQANVKIFPVVVVRLLGLLIRASVVTIGVYFVNNFKDYSFIPFSRVLETLVVSIGLVFVILKVKQNFSFKWDFVIAKVILYRGLKFWPALVFMYLFQRLDRFFIEKYFSYDVLGQYAIAVQIMEQGFLLLGMIVQSISPRLIYIKTSCLQLKKNVFKLAIILFGVSVVGCFLGYLSIPYIIKMIYGDQYIMASDIARSMLIVLIFFSIDTVIMQYFYREKLAKYIFIKWVILSFVMVCGYYIAYEIFELKSLSAVYILSYFLMLVFSTLVIIKRFKYES